MYATSTRFDISPTDILFALIEQRGRDISGRIHVDLEDYLCLDVAKWQAPWAAGTETDQEVFLDILIHLDYKQLGVHATPDERTEMITKFIAILHALTETGKGKTLSQIARLLYRVHAGTGLLFPFQELHHPQIVLDGCGFSDGLIEGMWAQEGFIFGVECVVCKEINISRSTSAGIERFAKETAIWRAVYEKDQGKYVLPYYGIVRGTVYPSIVTPSQCHRTAIAHVRKSTDINYVQLIKAIAKGVEVLHTMDPPVVHGSIRGSSILISNAKTPLLADYGLAKLMLDLDVDREMENQAYNRDFYRWYSSEIILGHCRDTSMAADIYALAMTVLELLTGKNPWSHLHRNVVADAVKRGERHPRPEDEDTVKKGLNDGLWALLLRCWETAPADRPSIQNVIQELDVVWPEEPLRESPPYAWVRFG